MEWVPVSVDIRDLSVSIGPYSLKSGAESIVVWGANHVSDALLRRRFEDNMLCDDS